MALTSAKRKSLQAKEKKGIISATGTIEFQEQIELSVKSEPLSGLIKHIGKSKGGNFKYAFTGDEGFFTFYSNEELEFDEVEEHEFSISTTKDGKKFIWFS